MISGEDKCESLHYYLDTWIFVIWKSGRLLDCGPPTTIWNPLALAPLIKAIKVGFQKRKLMWRQIYKQPSEILLGLNSKNLFVWCYCPKHDKLLVENNFQLYMCNWFSFIFKWHHYCQKCRMLLVPCKAKVKRNWLIDFFVF